VPVLQNRNAIAAASDQRGQPRDFRGADLGEVVHGMRATVEATVRPVRAGVWLRAAREVGR
jgi:hypothetical protein